MLCLRRPNNPFCRLCFAMLFFHPQIFFQLGLDFLAGLQRCVFKTKSVIADSFNFPLHFSQKPWYTVYEVRAVQFRPFVYDAMNRQVPVAIEPMTPQDAALTDREPLWQTSWTSEYLADENYEKYAARVGDELIALAAYEVLPTALVVHIVYMEAQPESNPTLDGGTPKYRGIGRLLIAYGIKLSIDSGLTGDVVLEAKTTSLAKHYEEDFGAVLLPTFQSSAPRYLIADEAAKRIFFTYLD